MVKSTISMAIFNSYVWHNQRVKLSSRSVRVSCDALWRFFFPSLGYEVVPQFSIAKFIQNLGFVIAWVYMGWHGFIWQIYIYIFIYMCVCNIWIDEKLLGFDLVDFEVARGRGMQSGTTSNEATWLYGIQRHTELDQLCVPASIFQLSMVTG